MRATLSTTTGLLYPDHANPFSNEFWKTSTGLTSPSSRWPLPNILAGGYARWLQSDQSTSSERLTSHHSVAGYGDYCQSLSCIAADDHDGHDDGRLGMDLAKV